MAFKKDYKALYEATKADLKDQVDYSVDLEQDLEAVKKQFKEYQNSVALRERVAERFAGSYGLPHCEKVLAWITQTYPAEPLKAKRKIKTGLAATAENNPVKKRAYKKRSTFWKKKKK